ncbi:MAG: NAD(P)H-quinone oxidoreductase [Aestuariivita sp.]|nr:NAD(P)H-quinone oxidoreductase [Aestuariivita sp.]MCY4203968.1 NAD(P)H-quinone oxidoreductase [Aestuariivita sp.]MCY4290093.1 NAD(P)H-quinone oxidoreductase [Aestuariivita sp.]MCY4346469.1 NAD(P)H-quinone oxidoreductase [Aestuariivita sp.]
MQNDMRVMEISTAGGPEVLSLASRRIPKPQHDQVVIKVAWAGVNRPDILQRMGAYAPPANASDLPGLEASGEIIALGEGVVEWSVGDQVCALLPGGGYADYAVTSAAHCLPIPASLSLREAACLPETFFTVYSNVFMRGKLAAGEIFLVHGGSSGIGTTAIQLGKLFAARVFTTAGSEEKCAACTNLGAERAIHYHDEDFVSILLKEGGADLILDMVGGSYIARNLKALAEDGRLIQIAFLHGSTVELNLARLMTRRLIVTGSTLRPQSDLAKAKIAQKLRSEVWPYLENKRIQPVIDSEFPLENAHEAHRRMESSAHIGKIVLKVADSK